MKKFCLVFRIISSVQFNPFYKSIAKIIYKIVDRFVEKIPYFSNSLFIQ
ncbi:hypothetical protein F900_01146 [Acinetobacter modestus]|uniref:Uncharacterized protein n=1 Tax=Acinetobacter modestus TaxID=1776740 RepID=N9M2H0_9GAMM|nr:hypothetical protein F900_01146 [Acinetobacter modestus]